MHYQYYEPFQTKATMMPVSSMSFGQGLTGDSDDDGEEELLTLL